MPGVTAQSRLLLPSRLAGTLVAQTSESREFTFKLGSAGQNLLPGMGLGCTSQAPPNAMQCWRVACGGPLGSMLHFPITPFSISCGIAMLENTKYIAPAQIRAAKLIAHVAPANTSPSSYMSTHSTFPTSWAGPSASPWFPPGSGRLVLMMGASLCDRTGVHRVKRGDRCRRS